MINYNLKGPTILNRPAYFFCNKLQFFKSILLDVSFHIRCISENKCIFYSMSENFSGNIIIKRMFSFLTPELRFLSNKFVDFKCFRKIYNMIVTHILFIKWFIYGRTLAEIRFCYLHSPCEPQKKGVYYSHNFFSLFLILTYFTS